MGLSEISEIKTATNYAIESKNNNNAKNEIINLFSANQFNNGGESSVNTIEEELQTLQNFITGKNSEYNNKNTEINSAQDELTALNKKLEDEIFEITKQANKEEAEQRKNIEHAITEVNNMYMNGDIEKSEMSAELTKKISRYANLSSGVTLKLSGLSGTKAKISALTSKIASLIDAANSIESEINTATGTVSLMQNLLSKMTISGSVNTGSENTSGAIGFNSNGKTFSFITDKNNDNKVNGSSEFLGATNSFDELKNLDTNQDNIVSQNELGSNNMFVLMTDNQTGSSKFMSLLESGISSINLSTITSESFNELEEPQVQNIFTVNTVSGASVQGFQNASISGFDNTALTVNVDGSVLDDAQNIFAKGASLSAEGLDDNVTKAEEAIVEARAAVKTTAAEMAANDSVASTKLTKQDRPETQEEKEQREEKEAEEAKKAEEEKKTKEEEKAKKEEEIKKAEEEKAKKAEEEKKKEQKEKEQREKLGA